MCDQCHGIHMVSPQSVEGIQESRIFVEEEGLLFSSELEVRPHRCCPWWPNWVVSTCNIRPQGVPRHHR